MKRRKIWIFVLLSVFFLPSPDARSAEMPGEIARNAALADCERFPDSDVALLFDDEKVRYDEAGVSETADLYAYKILTERGRRSLRSLPLRYNRHYQQVSVRRMSVFRNGREIVLDPASLCRDESDASSLKMNICDPDDRILLVSFPELEIGDVLLIEHGVRDLHVRMPGSWHTVALLQSDMPVMEYRYTVDAPKTLPPVAVALRDEIPGSVEHSRREENGRIVLCWTARNVPRVFPEKNIAGKMWQYCQRLHLSTVRSWQDVSRWYDALCRPHLEAGGDDLKAAARELCRDAATPEEKADRLFRFVSQEVRYMGLTAETEAPGYEPHDVAQTFRNRAGVCRDKAALLVAMLDVVGLKAHMVLIMAGDRKDPDVPDPAFNHAIVAWENEPGKYVLMDPTAENSREKLPVWDADSSFLVATPKGETLLRSPVPAPETNRMSIQTDASLDVKGKFTGHTVIRPVGIFETIYRDVLQGHSPDEQQAQIAGWIGGGNQKFRLDDLVVTPQDLADTSRPLEIAFDFSFAEALPECNGDEVLPMPRFAENFAFREVFSGVTDIVKRRYPQQLRATCLIEERITVNTPFILEISALPEPSSFRHRIADWDCRYSRKENVLNYDARLRVKALRVEPDEYPALRTLRRKLKAESASLPVARLDFSSLDVGKTLRTFPGVDSVVLSDDVRTEILSPGEMRINRHIRRCILTKNGVRTESEAHLPYRPERSDLSVEGKVIDRDGTVHVISDADVHEIDDPAFSGAPRYACGKMKIVNLPGVKIGSVIDLTMTQTFRYLPFCSERCVFGRSPTVRASYTLICDPDIRLRISPATRNFTEIDTREDQRRVHIWSARNLPGFRDEKHQPSAFFFADTVAFSTGNLEKYAENLTSSLRKAAGLAGDRVEAVGNLLNLKADDPSDAKLVRIRDWVDRNIRQAGPALSQLLPDEFSSPETTLADGYGNSADRAILIAALCHIAGFECDFLFIAPHCADDQIIRFLGRYPGRDYNSVLVRPRDSDFLLNDTGAYAALGATASEGKVAFDAAGKLHPVLAKIGMESGIRTHYRIAMRADGGARIAVRSRCFGNFFEREKRRFAELTPEFFRRYFEGKAAGFSPGAVVIGKPRVDFSVHPGVVSFIVDVPDFAARIGEYLSFDLPGYREMLRVVNVGEDRRTPYVNQIGDIRVEYEIVLPENYRPTTRPDGRRELGMPGTILYNGQSRYSGNKIFIGHHFLLYPGVLIGAEAVAANDIHKRLNRLHEWRIVLEKIRGKGASEK
ncbi:MAG: DUF3857 domain-containing protein [Victivallaceae bacterium]|nr:DUF3857 domain-containing protein [Victivallaceae bacterium]